ncbi:MAG: hypothetical protein IJB43_07780 [Clostridia bacterium]|nr:hypothetical protein [Clostridia bacterium]
MTKRALALIALLMILPVAVAIYAIDKYKDLNPVVAQYCGGVDTIEYDGVKLHRVEGAEEYRFRFGEYLGRVGDALTGAPLYRVLNDETGAYYAIAEGKSRILYTVSGKLVDGIKGEDSTPTLLVFDDFLIVEEYVDIIEKIIGVSGKRVSVDMSNFTEFRYYDLYLAFDSSAIVTEYFGRLIYLTERESWILISREDLELAAEEYGDEIDETVYLATLIADKEVSELIDSYFEEKTEETNE